MWIYPDDVLPEGHKAKPGDVVIITRSEYGVSERQVGLVVATDGYEGLDHILDVILLPAEDDGWLLGG